MELDVLGLGYSCLDDLLLLSEIPGPEGRAAILRREQQGGGMAATAMVAVARLGGRAGFIAKVGGDSTGAQILAEFRAYGVDVSRAVTQPGATSHLTVVLVESATGDRAFLSQPGTVEALQPAELDREYVAGAVRVHLSDAQPAALQAAGWAKAAGREVCFDGTHFHPAILDLIPYVDYLIVSRFFAAEFVAHQEGRDVGGAARTFARAHDRVHDGDAACGLPASGRPRTTPAPGGAGAAGYGDAPVHHGRHGRAMGPRLAGEQLLDAAERLRRLGPPVVVVTEGERGSWCAAAEASFHVPAYPIQPVVDTTGAGDVFRGAFLLARGRGWELRRSLALASAAAGLKCRALGGRAGIPSLPEALALVEG